MTLTWGHAALGRRSAGLVAAAAVVALGAFAVGSPLQAQDDKEIRFGASLALTGRMATEGRLVKDGYDFMVKHINEQGGIPVGDERYKVSIVYYDDESDPNTGARLAERLIVEDQVDFLLGPYSSSVTFPVTAIAERHQIPMVQAHAAATNIYEQGFHYIFATLNTIDQYFGNIVNMAAGLDPRPQTIALLAEDALAPQLAAEAAAERAREQGIEVVYHESYPTGTTDFSTILSAMRAQDPDIVLAAGYTADMIVVTRQAHEMGLAPDLFGLLLGPTLPGFTEALGQNANYVLEPVQWSSHLSWEDEVFGWSAADYARMFEEEFGYAPDYHPPQSSAALMVYYHALQKAGTLDRQAVRDAIAGTDIMTFYGPVRFDEKGRNVGKGMAVVQLQDLEPMVVYPPEAAEAELIYPMPH